MGRGKNNNKKRAPHATSKEEVIQRYEKSTPKPQMSEEDQLTLSRAKEILEERDKIISEAEGKKKELEGKIEELEKEKEALTSARDAARSEKDRIEASFAEKKNSLRLDAESQAILDKADEITSKASGEAEKLLSNARAKAESDAAEVLKKAETEAGNKIKNAEAEAEKLLRDKAEEAEEAANQVKASAKEQADELLKSAREQEKEIIDNKEEIAQRHADTIISKANDYEARIRDRADQYEQKQKQDAEAAAERIKEAAERRKDAVIAELEEQRAALNDREAELTKKEVELVERAEQLAEQRTAAKKQALEEKQHELADKEAELRQKEFALSYKDRELAERDRQFQQLLEEEVKEQYIDTYNELESKKAALEDMVRKNAGLHQELTNAKLKGGRAFHKSYGENGETLAAENERLERELESFRDANIDASQIPEILSQRELVRVLQDKVKTLTAESTTHQAAAARNVGAAAELEDEKKRSAYLQELVDQMTEKLAAQKQISRSDMLRPIRSKPSCIAEQGERDPESLKDELKWLEHIKAQAKGSGIEFSDRLLHAYHTSLKIGEWSPLVVLAGVSGTGKSELPKQYAIHGGMNFLSLPVKPDWDSPASMFGYYNSIENKFEATELIQALYQMQDSDGMLMVLLDEMNLAHPEQYFADLLSKFEEARGSDSGAVYNIVLGAGEDPEPLRIGNNVLWTGTMNEDETTKGLSDKVVDRSTLITFPRPKTLISRTKAKMLDPEIYLTKARWESWKNKAVLPEGFVADKLYDFKAKVESLNGSMSLMGRNMGHRVWQGIMNYILNYPKVIKESATESEALVLAMNDAFCDALSFKMMPKLRGLETRGNNESHLENIEKALPEQLQNDFRRAREQTSEIFQWSSSEFMDLRDEEK